tara:strand:- start:17548 stop:18261 length:714 start_codon:yes stop_codon:yes gene_type:complete
MDKSLPILSANALDFPNPNTALIEPNGLLAAGGDLSPARLIAAYQQGIFPWFDFNSPILWWSPDPRAILRLDNIIISKSLKKLMGKQNFNYSADQNFSAVIDACSNRKGQLKTDTWITPELKQAYIQLHELGYAHSIEIYQQDRLVGGLYGVCIGRCFFGESMFHEVSNMSKIALVILAKQLRRWGFEFIDCQVWSPHLASMGTEEIPRKDFLSLLSTKISIDTSLTYWKLDHDLRL